MPMGHLSGHSYTPPLYTLPCTGAISEHTGMAGGAEPSTSQFVLLGGCVLFLHGTGVTLDIPACIQNT